MKVYVITKGCYSDYHICAVALTPEDAENLKRRYSDNWESAEIEEYDTEIFKPILENKTLYVVSFDQKGNVIKIIEDDIEYFETGVTKYRNPYELRVTLFADDTESAIKIAAEKRAMYLAEKNGI